MAASGKSKKKMSLNRRNTLVGLSFILPNFIGFFIFVMIPVAFSLMLSFADWDGFNPMKFAGLDDFVAIFKDPGIPGIYLENPVFQRVYRILFHVRIPWSGDSSESETEGKGNFPLRHLFPLCGFHGCGSCGMEFPVS